MFKIKSDIGKVLKDLEGFGEDAAKMIDDTTYANALEITEEAKVKAPKNTGKLAQSIFTNKESDLLYSINVGLDYGAYIEFGTGKNVFVPAELSDVASKFKSGRGGSFEEGLQSIKDWCRAKGIDEKNAYVIFMSVLRKGITPRPFLYPAFMNGRKQYLEDLKNDFKELKQKYG